jgi:uncharacterized protein YdcH (DUF465 family)
MMERDKELIEKLLMENKEFKILREEHVEFERKIEELMKKRPQTSEVHFEIETLKKKKLQGKDKMERILTQHR